MRASAMLATLVAARCFVEAVTFSALAAVAHAALQGSVPLAVVPAAFLLFGGALLLVALLREVGTERRSATIVIVTLGLGVAWGLALPTRGADGLAILTRAVVFGILAEAFLWRTVSIARGVTRWTDARNAVPVAAFAVGIAALLPGPIERGAFAGLSLLALAASAFALSLARTSEELELARGLTGRTRASSATSATVVLGVAAVLVAAVVPLAQELLGRIGEALAPAFSRILYLLVLPFAYLAAFVVELLRPLVTDVWRFRMPERPAVSPEEEAELLRQMEETRPYIFGAIELVIVAVAAIVALVLFERMLRERRLTLPEGVSLEREPVAGLGLRDTLRSLRPRRPSRRRAPRDDGTPAAAIRLAYWRFLAHAERRGLGWRETSETPAEHGERVASSGAPWPRARVIVRAFEDVRYGEVEPDAGTVAGARDALRALEAATR